MTIIQKDCVGDLFFCTIPKASDLFLQVPDSSQLLLLKYVQIIFPAHCVQHCQNHNEPVNARQKSAPIKEELHFRSV